VPLRLRIARRGWCRAKKFSGIVVLSAKSPLASARLAFLAAQTAQPDEMRYRDAVKS